MKMSNFQTTVSIADIYGAEWWERNKAELEREWEWEFGWIKDAKEYASCASKGIMPVRGGCEIRIILHSRKPKPPTLREVYGTDEVTIPQGWEWTGEWREPKTGDHFQSGGGRTCAQFVHRCEKDTWFDYRLILRERPKKVWFKAEEKARCPKAGDYIWTSHRDWAQAEASLGIYLCATRHEEPDTTIQTVTQADIDRLQKVNN